MHLLARAACHAGDTATGTTHNETQKVRAAAVPRPVPTSALSPYIRTCSRAAGTPTMLHILLLFPALDHGLPPTPSRMHQLYHGAVRYPFSLWYDLVATRLFTVPFPVRYTASRRTLFCRPRLSLPEMCCCSVTLSLRLSV